MSWMSGSPTPPPPATYLDDPMQLVNDCHLTFDGLVFTLVLCGLWANHMWRLMCLALAYFVIVPAIGGSAPAACSHRCIAHALPACAGAYTSDSCPIYEPIVRGWSAHDATVCVEPQGPA